MNRKEFMSQLELHLQGMAPNELRAAIDFYNEYFDDAGIEGEQSVIEELGSPQKLAKQILSENNNRIMPDDWKPQSKMVSKSKSGWSLAIILLLLFFGWPVILAAIIIVFTLFFVLFVLIGVFIFINFIFITVGIYALIGWIAGIGGIWLPGISFPFGIAGLGVVLTVLGLGLIMILPSYCLIVYGVPVIIRGFVNILNRKNNNSNRKE